MRWHSKAYCINSKVTIGRIYPPEFDSNLISKNNHIILVSETIDIDKIAKFIHDNYPFSVVAQHGSLADHTAVTLNNKGIQLSICPDIPKNFHENWALIDGIREEILIDTDQEFLMKEFLLRNRQKIQNTQLHNKPTKLMYKGDNIKIYVDGSSAIDIKKGIESGADGVGILRTEWQLITRSEKPTFDELYSHIIEAQQATPNFQLNVRLFDLGGDKCPNWLTPNQKTLLASPLGLRGIRAIEILKDLFDIQLKVLSEILFIQKIGIVVPMVTSETEINFIKERLKEHNNSKLMHSFKIGAMVESPTAALEIGNILKSADFIRIGPGDLTQFTLGKLRSNFLPSEFSRSAFHPSVIRLIKIVADKCRQQSCELSICLDFEPRLELLHQLLQAGIRKFCIGPEYIGLVREMHANLCNKYN